jgi:hypothetical protein
VKQLQQRIDDFEYIYRAALHAEGVVYTCSTHELSFPLAQAGFWHRALWNCGLRIENNKLVSGALSSDEWITYFEQLKLNTPHYTNQYLWQAWFDRILSDLTFTQRNELRSTLNISAHPLYCAHVGCTHSARHTYEYVPLCYEHVMAVSADE